MIDLAVENQAMLSHSVYYIYKVNKNLLKPLSLCFSIKGNRDDKKENFFNFNLKQSKTKRKLCSKYEYLVVFLSFYFTVYAYLNLSIYINEDLYFLSNAYI